MGRGEQLQGQILQVERMPRSQGGVFAWSALNLYHPEVNQSEVSILIVTNKIPIPQLFREKSDEKINQKIIQRS